MSERDWELLSDKEKLQDIKNRHQRYQDIIERSKNRLSDKRYNSVGIYYLLNNFKSEFTQTSIEFDFGKIQEIEDPPMFEKIAYAIDNKHKHLSGNIIGFVHEAKYELFISDKALKSNPNFVFLFSALLRIKTGMNFIISYGATKSWSTIMGAEEGTLEIEPYEEVDKVWKFGNEYLITIEDINWVSDKINIFELLCEDNKFRTAIESYTTFNQILNLRMATALIWAGIESLFEINTEISFRLSIIIASFMYERGEERYNFYNKFRKMYHFRSKAVHGSKLIKDDIYQHLDNAKDILREILIRIINDGEFPTKEEFEKRIFL